MKKALLWIGGILVCTWIALLVAGSSAKQKAEAKEWPMALGTLAAVPARYPATQMSPAAASLIELAKPAGLDLAPRDGKRPPLKDERFTGTVVKELSDWNAAQLTRSDGRVDAQPPAVAAYLLDNAGRLDAVRDHLLRGETLTWDADLAEGAQMAIPNLLGHMQLTRVLVARSLEKSRVGDPTAWDELRAAWNLNRDRWKDPSLISSLIALATTRMVNAASAKAPGTEPAWYAEVRSVDVRKAMLAAYQVEAWMISQSDRQYADWMYPNANDKPAAAGFLAWLGRGYLSLSAANAAEHLRLMAVDVAGRSECAFDVNGMQAQFANAIPSWNVLGRIAIPNIASSWERMQRYELEREATARLAELKRGEVPSKASRCADGAWVASTSADGTRSVRFSRELPVPAAPAVPYPLAYTLPAAP
jgi:hypothetical protein